MAEVRLALFLHDAKRCMCFRPSDMMCPFGSEPDADRWIRFLLTQVAQRDTDLEAAFRAGFSRGTGVGPYAENYVDEAWATYKAERSKEQT